MAVTEGTALRAFDALEAVLPHMRATITSTMPTLTAICDDEIAYDFDDRALLREARDQSLLSDTRAEVARRSSTFPQRPRERAPLSFEQFVGVRVTRRHRHLMRSLLLRDHRRRSRSWA